MRFVAGRMLSWLLFVVQVFTSPTPDQILEPLMHKFDFFGMKGAGVFLVIRNYSGDIMNLEWLRNAETEYYVGIFV